MHLLAGIALGLALSLGLAFALESLDKGVYTAAELERATGLSVFGSIPCFRRGKLRVKGDRDRFLALRDDPEGPIAESYRGLRANLKFAVGEATGVKTLAFTSSTQGEGKSVTNIDVALSFASAGKRVLLVDADMRRPTVNKHLEVPLTPGLSEVLAGELSWTEAVHAGALLGLDVLSAGHQPPRPSDLLDSEACGALVQELRDAYDLVVFDVPPVLAVSDIGSFAAKLDAVLLLCRSEKLPSRVLAGSAQRLRQAGANLIGAVLNAARPRRTDNSYGYGYGYGYGYEPSRRSTGKDAA
jgi:capsular exopolysaccharide synthesis family protein